MKIENCNHCNTSNEISNKFFDWLDECPVIWHLEWVNDHIMKYTFEVTEEDETLQRNEEEAYQKDYIKHGRAE